MATSTQMAVSSTAPSIITESMQRLLQVRDLWTRSQKDQLEIGRLCYLERNERFSVGGRSIHEGFAAWCKEAGMSRASAYRRIAEYEISIGEREEETVKKPVSSETSFEPAAYYQNDRKFQAALDFLKANPQSNVSVTRDAYTGKRGGTAFTWAVQVDNTEASRCVDATSEKDAESKKKHLIALGTESKPPEPTAAPESGDHWYVVRGFLPKEEADALYAHVAEFPWMLNEGNGEYFVDFGKAYTKDGTSCANEIPEIDPTLLPIADRVTAQTKTKVNYVQCHRMDKTIPVKSHPDPKDMIVPMLVLGQSRTFRLNDHGNKAAPVLRHGDLLVFTGNDVYHSMPVADKDKNFDPAGFETRYTLLFRWTTDSMRKFGCANTHGKSKTHAAEQAAGRLDLPTETAAALAVEPQQVAETADPDFVRLKQLAKNAGYHLATSARDGTYDLLGLTAAQVETFLERGF